MNTVTTFAHTTSDHTIKYTTDTARDWHSMVDYTRHIDHQLYHCKVYSWLAEGHIKIQRRIIQKQFFLYTEYRDKAHASQYAMFSFPTLQEALTFQTEKLAHTELPHIDPAMTRRYPIPVK